MGVDHTPGQTRDFFTAEGKEIAPARWHYSAHGGYPKKPGQKAKPRTPRQDAAGHRGMTDFDKILPRLDGKVKW